MNTDDMVRMLAANVAPVSRNQNARRYAIALSAGLFGGALILVPWLGVRPQLAEDAQLALFWGRFGFVAMLLAGGFYATMRLSRPGASVTGASAIIAAPLVAMWIAALLMLIEAAPDERMPLVLGSSWFVCPTNIAILSLPAFAAAFWAMRGLAPTRLRWAGAGAGLFAGAVGALVYTFYCPELAPPFLGVWYVLGMLIPAAVGALLGPRLLRW